MEQILLTIEDVLALLTPEEKVIWGSMPDKERLIVAGILEKADKAQLKKVVEWLEEHSIWALVPVLDLEKGEVQWNMRCISDEDWQALLKETGLEVSDV